MVTVRDILVRKGPSIISGPPETTVGNAVRKMVKANVGSMVIVVDHQIVGIFTERDLLFRVVGPQRHAEKTLLSEVMSSPVLCCSADDDTEKCACLLLRENKRHLVVAEEFGPVGLISLRDVLREEFFNCSGEHDRFAAAALMQNLEPV